MRRRGTARMAPGPRSSYLELEPDVVDGDGVLARVVLGDARQEGLREVEAGDPEDGGRPTGNPVLGHTDRARPRQPRRGGTERVRASPGAGAVDGRSPAVEQAARRALSALTRGTEKPFLPALQKHGHLGRLGEPGPAASGHAAIGPALQDEHLAFDV